MQLQKWTEGDLKSQLFILLSQSVRNTIFGRFFLQAVPLNLYCWRVCNFSGKPAAVPSSPSRKVFFSSLDLSVPCAISAGRIRYSKAQEESWTTSHQNPRNCFLLGKNKGGEISTGDGFIQEHLICPLHVVLNSNKTGLRTGLSSIIYKQIASEQFNFPLHFYSFWLINQPSQ